MAFKRMFSYSKVDIPNRSGHNVDHRHAFTAKCGTLVPSFSDFLIPGDTVSVAPKFSVQMAPQATDFIGRINLRTELFFVPLRCIWSGWKDFITYASNDPGGPAPDDPNYHAKYIPGAEIGVQSTNNQAVFHSYDVFIQPADNYSQYEVAGVLTNYVYEALVAANERNASFFFGGDSSSVSPSTPVAPSVSTPPYGAGSLLDYLGFKVTEGETGEGGINAGIWNQILLFLRALDDSQTELASQLVNNLTLNGNTRFLGGYFILKDDGTVDFSSTPDATQIYWTFQWDTRIENGVEEGTFDIAMNIPGVNSNVLKINNILKLVCYHKIWDDWYRDARVMKKLFPNSLGDSPAQQLATIPYITKFGGGFTKKWYTGDQLNFYDGKSLFDLRQRLWQKDYFTTMTQAPQSGDAMSVQVQSSDDGSGVVGEFTIASLRVANAMQIWRERNNLVDARYGDVQFAQYGVYPSDAVTDRAIYLGSNTTEIYNKTVYQQGEFSGNSNNPFNSVGTKYATPIGVGQGLLCNDYKVTEHGYLMALTSIVPEPSYSSGTRRDFHYDQIDDIAFPLLQGVGDQAVFARELMDTYSGEGDKTVVGYAQRYSEYKFINDYISGLLRDGESLSAFALQRSFSEAPTIGSEFLEIPVDFLDQVSAVGVENSKYGAWIESYWRYSKVSSLSELNAIPTLGRMPDVHQIVVEKAGKRL